MNTLTISPQRRPWYREPWPWLLMSGPAVVVVAGFYTFWLATTHADALVSDDYYRKGLAAQQTVASSDRARDLGLAADIVLADGGLKLALHRRQAAYALPPDLRLTISHPTRAGMDRTYVLQRDGDGYHAAVTLPQSGHWLILVEDGAKSWRLLGKVFLPAAQQVHIGSD